MTDPLGCADDIAEAAGDAVDTGFDAWRFGENLYPLPSPSGMAKFTGDCDYQGDLFWSCTDVPFYFGDGTDIGNVYLTGDPPRPEELQHEKRHATQWAILNEAFLPLYILNQGVGELLPGPAACWNLFEWSAGYEDGGYDECDGLGQPARPPKENSQGSNMRRLLVVAILTIASSACSLFPGDPSQGRALGISLADNGRIQVLYKPCVSSRIEAIRFVDQIGSVFGDEDDRVLWEVRTLGPFVPNDGPFSFTVGVAPQGFEEIVPLTLPISGRVGVEVHTDRLTASEVFDVEELKGGLFLNYREDYLTEDQFEEFDTCD